MAYATTDTVLKIGPMFPQTTTARGYTNTVAVISEHLDRADSVINSMLARRYTVPFSPVPPAIRTAAEDMTIFFSLRSLYGGDNINTQNYEDLYNDHKEFLKELKEGTMDLVDTAGSVLTELGADNKIASNTEDYTPTFGEDTATAWKVDSEKLDAIADDRS